MRREKSIRLVYPAAACLLMVMPVAAAMRHTILEYVLAAAALLFFVKVMPFCRRRENLWMFFLVAVCSIPMNTSLMIRYIQPYRLVLRLLLRSFLYLLLLSVEEIVMGYITRSLWVRQYRLPYSERQAD